MEVCEKDFRNSNYVEKQIASRQHEKLVTVICITCRRTSHIIPL